MFSTRDMSVLDVYDVAADIGKDFERLIDLHGIENVEGLMQKVISVLEHLETAADKRADEDTTIESLQSTIKHFELIELKKNEERILQSKELEEIEEHYKQETQDLLATVKRLRDETRKLQSSLTEATERDSAFSEEDSYFEVELVNRLQNILDLKTENEEVKIQNEKTASCVKEARRKNRSTQLQMHLLLDERAELTAKVHDQSREMQHLLRQLGQATAECQDLNEASELKDNDPNRPRFSLQELRDILHERNSLKAKISDLEDELNLYRPQEDSGFSSHHLKKNPINNADDDCMEALFLDYGEKKDENVEEEEEEDHINDFDLPVQGPLPEDPEDAPWRKKESGIRKLFHRVFGKVLPNSNPSSTQITSRIDIPSTATRPSNNNTVLINNFGRSLTKYSLR
ncbi:RILPL1 [Lepeophtheirus salmonis]|uniref:RILPL1 n=1 Tax=Lepeophtheirus salmonis TaxID=72036 RepID=A0A7R8H1L8_LEPSM|nr:RILPL1 [Lepeophtheirus salmonis]CAF2813794.1 RILPL1 [Lepeophtheirus salmonis]